MRVNHMDPILEKAKKIKLAIFDVDGVMTDGSLYFHATEETVVGFHIHDGLGIQLLQKSGVHVAIISGRASKPVQKRADYLKIPHIYLGCADKYAVYMELKQKLNLTDEAVAYTGDDWVDIPVMRHVGLKIAVPNARAEIKALADWQTSCAGGQGAVRDVCEFILKAQGHFDALLQTYCS